MVSHQGDTQFLRGVCSNGTSFGVALVSFLSGQEIR